MKNDWSQEAVTLENDRGTVRIIPPTHTTSRYWMVLYDPLSIDGTSMALASATSRKVQAFGNLREMNSYLQRVMRFSYVAPQLTPQQAVDAYNAPADARLAKGLPCTCPTHICATHGRLMYVCSRALKSSVCTHTLSQQYDQMGCASCYGKLELKK